MEPVSAPADAGVDDRRSRRLALGRVGRIVLGLVAAIIAIAGGQNCTSPVQPAPVVPTDASEEE